MLFVAEVVALVEEGMGVGVAEVDAIGSDASAEVVTGVGGAGCFGSLSCSS